MSKREINKRMERLREHVPERMSSLDECTFRGVAFLLICKELDRAERWELIEALKPSLYNDSDNDGHLYADLIAKHIERLRIKERPIDYELVRQAKAMQGRIDRMTPHERAELEERLKEKLERWSLWND